MKTPEKIFTCTLINKSDVNWAVLEKGGFRMFDLEPGGEEVLHSYLPDCLYAQFSLIRRNGDGSFMVKKNSDWPVPAAWKNRWLMECVNLSPVEHQVIRVNDRAVHLFRGIPVTVPVDLDDPQWSWYERVAVKEIIEKVPDPEHPGYFMNRKKVVTEKTVRPDADLKKIKAQIDALNVKRGEQKIVIPRDIAAKLK